MSKMLSYKDVKIQSLSVYGQFGEKKWIPYAHENVKLERKNTWDLANVGIGKTLVIAAMGESLAANFDILKKYRDRFDLMTCDKGFGPMVERGVVPDYVMVCDCNIPSNHYEKCLLETRGVKLISTVYGNPMWTKPWMGDRYFYINKDAIQSEKKFLKIFPESTRVIPASSNVSNAMVVFAVGCDENLKINWMGYDQYLLVGYDYSWRPDGSYYAWNDPKPKRHYMTHRTTLDMNREVAFTSENLVFSARWLTMYLMAYPFLPVFNCSGRGLLSIQKRAKMDDVLSRINPDKKAVEALRASYMAARAANEALERAKDAFTKSREVLIWQ